MWKVEQIRHDLIREHVVAVREQKDLRPALPYSGEEHRQSVIPLHVKIEILYCLLLQIAVHVYPINSVAHVLEYALEAHRQLAVLHARALACVALRVREEVDETCKQISLRKIEQSVEDVDARLVELQEFVRVELVDL